MIACCRCFLESLVVRRTSPLRRVHRRLRLRSQGAVFRRRKRLLRAFAFNSIWKNFPFKFERPPRHRNPDSVLVPVNGGLTSFSAALLKQSHRIGTVLVPAFWDWSAVSLPSAPRAPLDSSVSHRYSTESGSCSFV